jgi:murein DD-endopeptidase MepM/ murein hydrolase activator NlpD
VQCRRYQIVVHDGGNRTGAVDAPSTPHPPEARRKVPDAHDRTETRRRRRRRRIVDHDGQLSGDMAFFAVLVTAVTLVPAAVMIFAGVSMRRKTVAVTRIPLEAVVVEYTNWNRPHKVTFDYPAPDGSPIRATRVVGLGLPTLSTPGSVVHPGDRLTVYVNPAKPLDVSLGDLSSSGGFGGIVLIAVGSMFAVGGLVAIFAIVGSM